MKTPRDFFTADLHLNHKAPVVKGWREFDSVGDMNECIISRWNEMVVPHDRVWILGDVFLGAESEGLALVNRLHGEKHLITGNHDKVWSGHRDAHRHFRAWLESFQTIQAFARRRIAGQTVLLSHFPFQGAGDHASTERYTRYRFPDDGSYLIHGHVHEAWKQRGPRMLNVGVDMWSYYPVPIEVISLWVEGKISFGANEMFLNGDTATASHSQAGTP